MVKSRGSFRNRQLALEFAKTVTAPFDSEKSRVSRAGKYSIFEVFGRCCPWAVRHPDGGCEDGVNLQEFNKVLEQNGFMKVRKSPPPRRGDPKENFADPNNPDYTGAYAFAKVRWRDPDDNQEDRAALVEGRQGMQVLFCDGANRIAEEAEFLARIREARQEEDAKKSGLSFRTITGKFDLAAACVAPVTSHVCSAPSEPETGFNLPFPPLDDARKRSLQIATEDGLEAASNWKRQRRGSTFAAQRSSQLSVAVPSCQVYPWGEDAAEIPADSTEDFSFEMYQPPTQPLLAAPGQCLFPSTPRGMAETSDGWWH